MKLLIACPIAESARNELRALVNELEYLPDADAATIREQVSDASILVVNRQRVGADIFGAAETLQMVVRAGEGVGEIAVDDASERGVLVCHCPGVYDQATAELALGMMVSLDRRFDAHTLELREGRWQRGEITRYRGLAGRCLGILGYGPEGQRLAEIASAIGMSVNVWHPEAIELENNDAVQVALHPVAIAEDCEYVCITPFAETSSSPVVDREFLDALPQEAVLVQVGHAREVDDSALAAALRAKNFRVGIDSHASAASGDEAKFRSTLFESDAVIGTPRLAHWTAQAREAVADEVARVIRAFLCGGEPRNCVNLLEKSPATWQLILRVRDQVGVMASILDAVRADGVNAEEITSRVFTGAKAAWCTIALDERPSREAVETIRQLPDIMHLEVRAVF